MDTYSVDGISFKYRDVDILKDVSFSVSKGEFLTLLGPNGTGKTTLLRILAGILVPYEGSIKLDGVDIRNYKRRDLAKKIAMVSQNFSIEFPFSVREVVLMGRYPHKSGFKMTDKEDMRICEESLELTDTAHLKERIIYELSAGELQRVLIARALCQTPSIILLDEPTTHLDINHQIELNALIKRLNEDNNLTVFYISHDLNAAGIYSDRVLLLKDKSIFMTGTAKDVITAENIKAVFAADVIVRSDDGDVPYVMIKRARPN